MIKRGRILFRDGKKGWGRNKQVTPKREFCSLILSPVNVHRKPKGNCLGTEKHNDRKGDIDCCLDIALLLKNGHIEPYFETKSKSEGVSIS